MGTLHTERHFTRKIKEIYDIKEKEVKKDKKNE